MMNQFCSSIKSRAIRKIELTPRTKRGVKNRLRETPSTNGGGAKIICILHKIGGNQALSRRVRRKWDHKAVTERTQVLNHQPLSETKKGGRPSGVASHRMLKTRKLTRSKKTRVGRDIFVSLLGKCRALSGQVKRV